jgi:hypothetical protein
LFVIPPLGGSAVESPKGGHRAPAKQKPVPQDTRPKKQILPSAAWLWLHFQTFSVVLPLPHGTGVGMRRN